MLVPLPTYPLYTAVLAKLGARARFYRTDPARGWMPDLEHLRQPRDAGDARPRRHRSEQPDRRDLFAVGRAARCSISRSSTAWRFWPTRCTAISASTGPVAADRQPRSRRADHLLLEPLEGLSRARMAHRVDGASAGRRGSTTW